MNTILCPTDFSATAENAVKYAAQLAADQKASILLLNVLHVPAVDVYSPANVINDVMEVQKKAAESKLEALCEQYREAYEVEMHYSSAFGFAAEVIAKEAEERGVEMICMGTTGSGSGLSRFLGSVSYDTTKRAKTPVLVIPGNAEYTKWKSVCVANDQQDPIGNELSILHGLCGKCAPDMDILTIVPGQSEYKMEVLNEEGGVRTVRVRATEVADAICRFVADEPTDILAMKRHRRNFIENLLHKSTIKQVLGHSEIPALVF